MIERAETITLPLSTEDTRRLVDFLADYVVFNKKAIDMDMSGTMGEGTITIHWYEKD